MTANKPRRRLIAATFVLGIALSGFFDGILLHQVLQWHHLLSLVPGARFDDLRTQVYADGLFHVAIYAVALYALVLLWRARHALDEPGAGGTVAGGVLLGFGAWNIADVGIFHWLMGIHRIRVNVPDPMTYDLIWFVGLGLAVAGAGLWVLRRGFSPGGRGTAAAMGLALLTAVPLASLPVPGGGTLIVLRPGAGAGATIDAVMHAGGSLILIDPEGAFVLAELPASTDRLPFYSAGAMLVTRSPAIAGCLAATKIA